MALPKKNQEQLWKQDDATKWRLILAHETFKEGGTGDKDTPQYWVDLMSERDGRGAPTISINDAMKLQTVLRTAHRDFLIEFIENDGIKQLNSLTMHYATVQNKTHQVSYFFNFFASLILSDDAGKGYLVTNSRQL